MNNNMSPLVLKNLVGNAPTSLNAFQSFLAPHVDQIAMFYSILWCLTALVLAYRLFLEYRNRHTGSV